MYYFLNSEGTLCHILEDDQTGEAPAPCNAKVNKLDFMRYQEGRSNSVLLEQPVDIPLCKHCQKSGAMDAP
jgi:hypothetical protein